MSIIQIVIQGTELENVTVNLDTEQVTALYLNQQKNQKEIARTLGVSKSGVNYFLGREESGKSSASAAKVLILDLETATTVALAFGRFKVNLGQANIVSEGGWILWWGKPVFNLAVGLKDSFGK